MDILITPYDAGDLCNTFGACGGFCESFDPCAGHADICVHIECLGFNVG